MNQTKNESHFQGEIRVASRIIDYLSSGLYESPSACLKELINNSYDADATMVNVFVKPDAGRIIIDDNGIGMNKDEFTKHFEKIAESHKRDTSDKTPSGRPKIGKIGIGFIAANELCEEMEIFSTKSGSNELLHITIDFGEMRKTPEERRRNGDSYAKADYTGEVVYWEDHEHFTRIFLNRVRGEAREILAGAQPQTAGGKTKSLYGKSENSILNLLKDPNLRSWDDFDRYSETLLEIALNIPVQYFDNWMPGQLHRKVIEFEKQTASLSFKVFYDGVELKKPIVFNPQNNSAFTHKFTFEGNHVSAYGYFYVQHGSIKPLELHGLLVRIRNAAVGSYDPQFWDFSQSEFSLIQRWVSVELWADDRLEDAMNIDRRTLRVTHPSFVELRKAVHDELRKVLKQARKEIYDSGNAIRKERKAKDTSAAVQQLAKEKIEPISQDAANSVIDSWNISKIDSQPHKKILKKYSVIDLYEIVFDVAKDTLTKEQLTRFINELTKRLTK